MNHPHKTAPLGRSAKSPGGARNLDLPDLSEVAKLIGSLAHRPANGYPICQLYLAEMEHKLTELTIEVWHPSFVEALHELAAYARLLRHSDDSSLQILQRSIRRRIGHQCVHDQATRPLWRALWTAISGYTTIVEMSLLADTVDMVVTHLRQIARRSLPNSIRPKGGLYAQRLAWADADR